MKNLLSAKKIAFFSNYIPQRCGIATFTASLCEAIASEFSEADCLVVSVNDDCEHYDYPPRVHFEVKKQSRDSYCQAAEFLNLNNVDIVSLQHEFGIYGGKDGSYVLDFLKALKVPAIVTLHTILKEPSSEQRHIIQELNRYCQRFVVMSERGKEFLENIYTIPSEKIDIIPHGVIDIPFLDPNFYKDLFNVEGKKVLLTFGLLSPNKGIEHVIKALPSIIKDHPDVVYIILGKTHPQQIAQHKESYREELIKIAKENDVIDHVIFYNNFVTTESLKEFIGAADIYITPYCNEAQICSGTLAYTFGAGKAIVSTPYWHAQELLANDRGILVPFSNSEAIAEGVHRFFADPALMTAMRKKAWKAGREMIWPVVALRYLETFEKAQTRQVYLAKKDIFPHCTSSVYPLPPLKLDHLYQMTDKTGMLQHATYNVPNLEEGYCSDDNARAFIVTSFLHELYGSDPQRDPLPGIYLAFLSYAFDSKSCRFRNFMNYQRHWMETHGAEDSHARTLWSMGVALKRSSSPGHRKLCGNLFHRGITHITSFTSPRAWAFSLLAIHEYIDAFPGDRTICHLRDQLLQKLADLYHRNASSEWKWFEQYVTYDNARLSHALILSGTSHPEMLEIGLTSLRWLLKEQLSKEGYFSPIGCHGFWRHSEAKAHFDQQPLEASAMVSACLAAFNITQDSFWKESAFCCFEWFLGRNNLGLSLYDPTTGSCCDGLLQDRINANQGAESTLSFYLAYLEIALLNKSYSTSP